MASYEAMQSMCIVEWAGGAQPAMHTIAELAGQPNQQSTRLPNGQGGPTSNAYYCRVGWVAQPAIYTIAEWDGWPNQQFLASQQSKRLPNGQDGPTTNTNEYIDGSNQQSA